MHTHPVGIAVNVSEPELSGDTTEQLEDSVRAYAERLVADLDLPILPRVSVSIRPAQDGVPPAAVSIGDHARAE